jgi:hypothetical protein
MDYRNPEDKKVLVDEMALMKALDALDELTSEFNEEDLYIELSDAIDRNIKKFVVRIQ